MGKVTPGVTSGNLNWPGAYHQCLDVRANTTVTSDPYFSGQYCTATAYVAFVSVLLHPHKIYICKLIYYINSRILYLRKKRVRGRIVVVVVFKRNFIIHTTEYLTIIYYLFVEQRIKFNLV